MSVPPAMGQRLTTAEVPHSFDDGGAYERFLGRWSRAVATPFLDWLAPPAGARWLDVGCGTGIFTSKVLERCAPAVVCAVDPSEPQLAQARHATGDSNVEYRTGDACALPFPDSAFDVVACALVLNFIVDRQKALMEMRRVARKGGWIAGYVWDFAAERSPSWPMRAGMRAAGVEAPAMPGTRDSTLGALRAQLEQAGLESVAVAAVEISEGYADFTDFWESQTPAYNPLTKMIATLEESKRKAVVDSVRAATPTLPDGTVHYSARAHVFKARRRA